MFLKFLFIKKWFRLALSMTFAFLSFPFKIISTLNDETYSDR